MPLYRPEIFIRLARWVVLLLVGTLAAACAPEVGISCANALDCSASGTRLCDRTQPGGYCTLEGCEEETCPDEAACVLFGRRIEGVAVDRLVRSYCMYKCDSRDDCRTDEGYDCFLAGEFGAKNEAQVLGNPAQRFCAPLPPQVSAPPPERDAGSREPEDAAMSMPEEDAGMGLPDAGADSTVPMSMPQDDGGA